MLSQVDLVGWIERFLIISLACSTVTSGNPNRSCLDGLVVVVFSSCVCWLREKASKLVSRLRELTSSLNIT